MSLGLYDDLYIPDDLMSSMVYRYFAPGAYEIHPILVKREILRHFSRLPEFLPNVFALEVCYFWASNNNDGSLDRTALVPVFFERVQRTLTPALELVLTSPVVMDSAEVTVFPRGSRELALFVVYALFDLITVCQAEKR